MRVNRTCARGFDHIRGDLALRLDLPDEADQWFITGPERAERERCPWSGPQPPGARCVAERRGQQQQEIG